MGVLAGHFRQRPRICPKLLHEPSVYIASSQKRSHLCQVARKLTDAYGIELCLVFVKFPDEMISPRKSAHGSATKHFNSSNEMPLRRTSERTLPGCSMCSSYVGENTITSPGYTKDMSQRTRLTITSNARWNMTGVFFSPNDIRLYRKVPGTK